MNPGDMTATFATAATTAAIVGFVLAGVALALIDLETGRMPNAITAAAAILCGGLLTAASVLDGDVASIVRLAAGSVGLGASYLAIAIASRGGLGMGDVKFAFVVGAVLAWHGWDAYWVGAAAPFVLGGIEAGVRVLRHPRGIRGDIAFAPWMLMGALAGLVAAG